MADVHKKRTGELPQKAKSSSNPWLTGYLVLLAVHLAVIIAGAESLRMLTKPMLMIELLVYYATISSPKSIGRRSTFLAVVFSWLGDVFLIFEGSHFFMAGLSAFLIAHLMYARVFWKLIRRNRGHTWNAGWLLGAGLYCMVFSSWLFKYLESGLKVPVLIYSLVIAGMLVLAVHVNIADTTKKPALLTLGALLFVSSDSILAINTFVQSLPLGNVAIMATYGLAQLFITRSIAQIS